MIFLVLLPHIPALFMTSLTQTDGHKIAAITVVFPCLLNVDFEQTGPGIRL